MRGIFGVLTIIAFAAGGFVALGMRFSSPPAVAPLPLFSGGDMVRMRAFDTVGMVVGVDCWRGNSKHQGSCSYNVRFAAIQSSTPTRLLGSGGTIDVAPVSLVRGVREFEIDLVKPREEQ